MTKHIAGFILFSLIVGTSAVVASLIGDAPDKMRSFTIRDDYAFYKRKKRRRRCRRRRKPREYRAKIVSHEITGAVFNRDTGLLTTSHTLRKLPYGEKRAKLVYHFYVSDEFETRHLRSQEVWGIALDSPTIVKNFEWLNRIDSKENVYVIAEYRGFRDSKSVPEFDEVKAVRVLIRED